MQSLPGVREVARRPTPQPQPQALAWDGRRLWLSSRLTREVYAFDPKDGAVGEVAFAPGVPYGLTFDGERFHALLAEEQDDRYVRRFEPGRGFGEDRIACPGATGSYLGWNGGSLILTQWYARRVYALGAGGEVEATYTAPHGICGCTVVDGDVFLLGTDDEESDDYFLTRMRLGSDGAACTDVARVPYQGRSLAWDGARFWTNLRERGEMLAFVAPSL